MRARYVACRGCRAGDSTEAGAVHSEAGVCAGVTAARQRAEARRWWPPLPPRHSLNRLPTAPLEPISEQQPEQRYRYCQFCFAVMEFQVVLERSRPENVHQRRCVKPTGFWASGCGVWRGRRRCIAHGMVLRMQRANVCGECTTTSDMC